MLLLTLFSSHHVVSCSLTTPNYHSLSSSNTIVFRFFPRLPLSFALKLLLSFLFFCVLFSWAIYLSSPKMCSHMEVASIKMFSCFITMIKVSWSWLFACKTNRITVTVQNLSQVFRKLPKWLTWKFYSRFLCRSHSHTFRPLHHCNVWLCNVQTRDVLKEIFFCSPRSKTLPSILMSKNQHFLYVK